MRALQQPTGRIHQKELIITEQQILRCVIAVNPAHADLQLSDSFKDRLKNIFFAR